MSGSGSQIREDSAQLQRLAAELARLGAESRTERSVKRVVPWVVSIAIHLGVFLLAIFITWTVANLPKKDDAVLVVADFNAMQYEPLATPTKDVEAEPSAVLNHAAELPNVEQLLKSDTASDAEAMSILGSGVSMSGNADAAFSRLAPQGGGDSVSFAGLTGTNARNIVYAIDASGSMIASFQIVVDELARSLSNLSQKQNFAVIFFQGDEAIESPPAGRLTAATREQRERTLAWIKQNIVPRGSTNPLAALKKAMSLKPDVIFLLSQDITGYGQFEIDQRDLLALLDKINPVDRNSGRRATQINCIQFMDIDPLETMQAIAHEHGGPNGFKFLSRKELGIGGQ